MFMISWWSHFFGMAVLACVCFIMLIEYTHCYRCQIGKRHDCQDCSGLRICDISGFCQCDPTHYGIHCSQKCNINCKHSICNSENGSVSCTYGCKPGFHGMFCDQRCSPNCVNGTCFSNNGTCVGGCTGEFSGDKCTQGDQQFNPFASFNILNVIIPVIIVFTGSIITFLIYKKNMTLAVRRGVQENVDRQTTAYKLSDLPNSENPEEDPYEHPYEIAEEILYENTVTSPYEELGDIDVPNSYADLHQSIEVVG